MIQLAAWLLLGWMALADPPIVMDGVFEEWPGRESALEDPEDAQGGAADVRLLQLTSDRDSVYLMVEFGAAVSVQGLDGTALLLLDADGDEATGASEEGMAGVDLVVQLTPPDPWHPERPGKGVAVRLTGLDLPADRPLTPYDIGWSSAPTHAGRRFEFRIARGNPVAGAPALFKGERFRARLVTFGPGGELGDETAVLTYRFRPEVEIELGSIEQPTDDPLARRALTALPSRPLRVVNWNVELGSIADKPEPFVRVLRALDPDVITLQELTSRQSAQEVAALLNEGLSPERWKVVFGEGGGNLRCAVASRLPVEPFEGLRLVAEPSQPDRTVRVAGATVRAEGRSLLVVSLHLTCCGRPGDTRDQKRQIEVESIRAALQETLPTDPTLGVIVVGDFNLVGERYPLDLMADGLDRDGSMAEIAPMMQLDGRTNATWADPGQPFAPGRLDYLVYSDSSLDLQGSFVLDCRDLGSAALARYGLSADTTAEASDHLPLVADFAWRSPKAAPTGEGFPGHGTEPVQGP